ncbi:MAG TPA: hypothetical protein VKU19_18395 [Bryobacteraceae bacterium]|nr:hypothetical protein [Bryobacteraceae bacterium]
MTIRRVWWLSLVAILIWNPAEIHAQTASCGPFTDVAATDPFCPFILQAFFSSVTQGTGPTTFSPNDLVPRNQMVTFFDRGMDLTLSRGAVRTAIGKTWAPTSTNGGIFSDAGSPINDIVSDGINLWIALNSGKILKVGAVDRRLLETWSMASGTPRKLGFFGGLLFIADNQGGLEVLNPATTPAGTATVVASNLISASNLVSMAFDGTNLWLADAASPNIFIYAINTTSGITLNAGANVDGMVFDGTNMWLVLANSSIIKVTIPAIPNPPSAVETLTIPTPVTDCRPIYDGNNIWIPVGNATTGNGSLYVVRPTTNLSTLPSSLIQVGNIPNVASPYVAAFDGVNVMIGGINGGTVALYKATSVSLIRTFNTGAASVRAIASDGRSFTVGDASGTRFYQY